MGEMVAQWLVADFTFLGVHLQNWMLLVLVIIALESLPVDTGISWQVTVTSPARVASSVRLHKAVAGFGLSSYSPSILMEFL